MNEKFCQSCGMPMTAPEHFGTNADGSVNEEYCSYCYQKGEFLQDVTLEQMIEECVAPVKQCHPEMTEQQIRKDMEAFLPTLKRWKTA